MHLLVRETRSLDEAAQAVDLGQSGADVVVLSFSDADLGRARLGCRRRPLAAAGEPGAPAPPDVGRPLSGADGAARALRDRPAARRAGLLALRRRGTGHPLPRHGHPARAAAGRRGATIPRSPRCPPSRPRAYARLDACFRHGGPANMARALRLAGHLAGASPDDAGEARADGRAWHPFARRRPRDGRARRSCSTARICRPATSRRSRRWPMRCGRAGWPSARSSPPA